MATFWGALTYTCCWLSWGGFSCKLECFLTDLVVSVIFILSRVRLVQFVLQLLHQVVLVVHDIQVLVVVPVPFVLLVLAGAADVVEDLPQLIMWD